MKPNLCALLIATALASTASGISLYSYGTGANLGHTDDGSSILLLPVDIILYNTAYNQVSICNNGKLSFTFLGLCTVSAPYLPNSYQATIGPFIADVDTTPFASGIVYYELSTVPSLLNQAKNQILQAYRDDSFSPTLLVITTYDHVGYYQLGTDKLNTFQVVIATNGTATYALFLYANIQWITDLSGEATKVGFNKGDGIDYFLPPIANPAALPLTSNVLVPGLYVYRIDGASIPAGPASILYPYGVAAGDASLPPADASSVLVALQQSINLYGSSVSSVYVNTDGFISAANLGGSVSNPTGFPTANGLFIAPFWANVDTTCAGKVYYRETNDSALLQRALAEIRRGYAADSFSPARLLVVTWAQVGYYNCQLDKTNTFQAIIASGGGTSYVLFIYDAMQWMNGDSSGVGQTGISAGDGTNYFSLYGSGTSSVLSLPIQSNVAKSGLFVLVGTAKLYPFGVSQSDTVGVSGNSPSVSFSFPHHNLFSNFCYVYEAGYISFGGPFGISIPFPLIAAFSSSVVIAPYWSDIDISVAGAYYYRTTTKASLLQRASAEIDSLFSVTFAPTTLLIATWNNVGYSNVNPYNGNINTFQAVVATDGSSSYLIYLYNTLQWYHSDYSVINSPQAGYAIDGTILTIPQSGSSDAISLTSLSNKHIPGMFSYAVPATSLFYAKDSMSHSHGAMHAGHSFKAKHAGHRMDYKVKKMGVMGTDQSNKVVTVGTGGVHVDSRQKADQQDANETKQAAANLKTSPFQKMSFRCKGWGKKHGRRDKMALNCNESVLE